MLIEGHALRGELAVFEIVYSSGQIPPHSHASARLALLLDGALTEITDGREDTIRKGDFTFWREGATHSDIFTCDSRSLQIELSRSMYRHLAAYFPPASSIAGDRFEGATQRLLREVQRFDEASPLALQSIVYEIVARAARLTTAAQVLSFAVTQAIRYAREYLGDPITLSDLAEVANVSPRRLLEHFNDELQTSPMDYIRTLRLERAETLLRETDLSPSEIAAQCGFYDHAHFCRLFKRRTGMTPGQFRTRSI